MPPSNLSLESVSSSRAANSSSGPSFADFCANIICEQNELPSSSRPENPDSNSTLVNTAPEGSAAGGQPAVPRDQRRQDEKKPDFRPAVHPFLPGSILLDGASAPLQSPGETSPLLSIDQTSASTSTTPSLQLESVLPAVARESVWAPELRVQPAANNFADVPEKASVLANSGLSGAGMLSSSQSLISCPQETLFAIRNAQQSTSAAQAFNTPQELPSLHSEIENQTADVVLVARLEPRPPEPEPMSSAVDTAQSLEQSDLALDCAALSSDVSVLLASTPATLHLAPILSAPAEPPASTPENGRQSPITLAPRQEGLPPDTESSPDPQPSRSGIPQAAKHETVQSAPHAKLAAEPPPQPVPTAFLAQADDSSSVSNTADKCITPTATAPAVATSFAISDAGKATATERDKHDSSTQTAGPQAPAQPATPTLSSGLGASAPPSNQPQNGGGFIRQNEPGNTNADHNATPSETSSPRTLASESVPAPGVPGVQMARMISKAAQSEMRIGLNTSAFGNIEVHTVVHANEVGVVIGSERGDLPNLITNELPGISHTLQQHDLRLNQVNFQHQGSSFSSDSQPGGNSQSRYFTPKANLATVSVSQDFISESGPSPESLWRPGAGLSLLA